MVVNADRVVKFRKPGNADLSAFVRIEQKGQASTAGEHSTTRLYQVSYDDLLRFEDGTRIDATCRIVWSELSKAAKLDTPSRTLTPFPRALAEFEDEN